MKDTNFIGYIHSCTWCRKTAVSLIGNLINKVLGKSNTVYVARSSALYINQSRRYVSKLLYALKFSLKMYWKRDFKCTSSQKSWYTLNGFRADIETCMCHFVWINQSCTLKRHYQENKLSSHWKLIALNECVFFSFFSLFHIELTIHFPHSETITEQRSENHGIFFTSFSLFYDSAHCRLHQW